MVVILYFLIGLSQPIYMDKIQLLTLFCRRIIRSEFVFRADSVTRNGLSVVRCMSKTPMTIIMVVAACDFHEIKVLVKIF